MKRSGIQFARLFAVLAMVLSLASLTAFSAAAAPAGASSQGMARAQAGGIGVDLTAEICRGLDGDANGFVSTEEAALIDQDINGDGVIDALDAEIAAAGCPAVLVPFLDGATVELCVDLDANADGIVSPDEALALQVDLNGDFAVDALDQAIATGDCTALLGGLTGGVLGEGTVVASKFFCPNLLEVEFDGNVAEGCVAGAATFSFFLFGDGTNEVQVLNVDASGVGTIDLVEGTFEVVEEGTQARTIIEVVEGQVTNLVVENPGDAPGGGAPAPIGDAPVGDAPDGGAAVPVGDATGGDATGGEGAVAVAAPASGGAAAAAAAPATGGTTVTALPATGSGQASGFQVDAWMLMAGVALVSAAGFQVTRKSTVNQ